MNNMAHAYLVCALWSSTNEEGEPLDHEHTLDDFAPSAIAAAEETCRDFAETARDLIARSGLSEESVGHDLWLTRNGHGAGFWDRGLGAIGRELSELCRPYGGSDVYEGADGRLYLS